jgi:hypothetical protein
MGHVTPQILYRDQNNRLGVFTAKSLDHGSISAAAAGLPDSYNNELENSCHGFMWRASSPAFYDSCCHGADVGLSLTAYPQGDFVLIEFLLCSGPPPGGRFYAPKRQKGSLERNANPRAHGIFMRSHGTFLHFQNAFTGFASSAAPPETVPQGRDSASWPPYWSCRGSPSLRPMASFQLLWQACRVAMILQQHLSERGPGTDKNGLIRLKMGIHAARRVSLTGA